VSGNILTDYGWGQFLLWHLFPDSRVAFDGRYRTVFPEQLEREFLEFQRADVARTPRTPMVDDYPTEIALLPVGSQPDRFLSARNDWHCVYRDEQAAVFLSAAQADNRLSPSGPADQVAPRYPRWQRFPGDPLNGTRVADGVSGRTVVADNAPRPRR
jgi:hypothetical protein